MYSRTFFLLVFPVLLTACAASTDPATPLLVDNDEIPEQTLLDVNILVYTPYDANAYIDTKNVKDQLIEFRLAEAVYMALVTADTLRQTKSFGTVNVVPHTMLKNDLLVTGVVLSSDDNTLKLAVRVTDASGRIWLKKTYKQHAAEFAYSTSVKEAIEPFLGLYRRIANDMVKFRQQLSAEQLTEIRLVSLMQFSREFSPEAFSEHLQTSTAGKSSLQQLPAWNDPIFTHIRSIEQRHDVYADTLQLQLGNFYSKFSNSYWNMRKRNFDNRVPIKNDFLSDSQKKALESDKPSNVSMTTNGERMAISEYESRLRAQMAFNYAFEPLVLQLDESTVQLHGTVTEQFEQWKAILREMYWQERQ